MNICASQDVRLVKWVENKFRHDLRMNAYFNPEDCMAFPVDDGKDLLAVVLVSNYQKGLALELNIISLSPRWASRAVLEYVFKYCFDEMSVRRIYTQVSSKNEIALRMNKRLGFQELTVLKDHSYDLDGNVVDMHIFTMTKNECKWYGK